MSFALHFRQGGKMIGTQTNQALTVPVSMNVNGVVRSFAVEPRTTLLDALRDEFSSNAKREAIFLWSQRIEDVVPSARRRRNCRPVSPAQDRRGATLLEVLYSDESSPQRRAKGTKNVCTSDTQRP